MFWLVKHNLYSYPGVSGMKEGTNLACVSDPFRSPSNVQECIDSKVNLLSMDMIPRRLSRAQSMDVNSSQDNLAGYKGSFRRCTSTQRNSNDDYICWNH